jgi:hypothetical protein
MIFWAAAAAVLLIAGGLWWSARARPHAASTAVRVPAMPSDIQVRLGKVRLYGISAGKLIWEVEADHFDYAKNRPTLTVSGLKKVTVLNGDKEELTLTASQLEQNTTSGRIILSGDVTVTGPSLKMHTEYASWEPRRDTLQFPGRLTMQLGDYTLTCLGATNFDVIKGLLTGTGGVTLATSGSTLRAESVRVNVIEHSFEMDGPVTAALGIADMETWMAKNQLPEIPAIPDSIKERYRDYTAKKERAVRPTPGLPRPKGDRP